MQHKFGLVGRPQCRGLTVATSACSTPSTVAFPLPPSAERGLPPEVPSSGTTLLRVMFSWMLQGCPLMEMFVGAMSCTGHGSILLQVFHMLSANAGRDLEPS